MPYQKPPKPQKSQWWPDMDTEPKGSSDLTPWIPPDVMSDHLAPVEPPWDLFPKPPNYQILITRKMGR